MEYVPVPQISDGEVLIRVAACGICGTDIKKIEHGFVEPPQIFGHEVAGTVVAVGSGVSRWRVGDRVVSFHHIPCGDCFYCQRRLFSQCLAYKKVGLTAGFTPNGGGFAEYVRAMPWIAERGMVMIPEMVLLLSTKVIAEVKLVVVPIRQDADRERSLRAGFQKFLVKPVDFDQLEALLPMQKSAVRA